MHFYKLHFFIVILLLGIAVSPALAQKRTLAKSAVQAITGAPAVQSAVKAPLAINRKTTAQLMQQTQEFINENGRRPRSMFYLDGKRLLSYQLTLQQRQEVQLAQALNKHFMKAAQCGISVELDPELSALQKLLQAHPNIPPGTQDYTNPAQLLARTKAFIDEHGFRPRSIIYAPGTHYKMLDEMTPQERSEIRLSHSIQYVLAQSANQGEGQAPEVQELALLWNQHTRVPQAPQPADLLVQLQAYLRANKRHPRRLITTKGKVVPAHQFTQEQAEEVGLARKVFYILNQARQNPQLAQTPEVHQLAALWKRPSAPTDEEILLELRGWVQTHEGRRPRAMIYRNGTYVPVKEMTPQEYQEYTLGARLQHILDKGVFDKAVRDELWEIYNLPTGAGPRRHKK